MKHICFKALNKLSLLNQNINFRVKKFSLGFSGIFSQTVSNFSSKFYTSVIRSYYIWRQVFIQLPATLMKLCHIKRTNQFTSYAQNVHHRPKRTLAFSDIFPKQLRIFEPNFMCILCVPIYAILQILLSNYLQIWRSYAIFSATTQRAFRPMVNILSMVVALNMAQLRQSCS